MTRNTEPKFTIVGEKSPERAARLALFVDILRFRPEATAAILRACGTVRGVYQDAETLPDERRHTFEGLVLRSAAQVLYNHDDLAALPDPESEQAIRDAISAEQHSPNPRRYDARILSMAAFACEHAGWQQSQGHEQVDITNLDGLLDFSQLPEALPPRPTIAGAAEAA